jgi:hypothetical protein
MLNLLQPDEDNKHYETGRSVTTQLLTIEVDHLLNLAFINQRNS